MEEYAKGNVEFLKMSESGQFDLAIAERLLAETKDINYPICDLNGYSTTYLYEAARDNNLEAVHFLLNYGANPNTYVPELISECPIWDMMYIDDDQDAQTRYRIAKLFFEYGASPAIEVDGETLYDSVVYEVYNQLTSDDHWADYLVRFLMLLTVYGGSDTDYGKPILINVDLSKVDEYRFSFFEGGTIIDLDGNVCARLCEKPT